MALTKEIKAELAKAYQCAMDVGILDMKAPLRYINQYVAEDVNGYGTAADEKVLSRKGFRKMAMDSRRQSKGMVYKAKIITPYRPKFINETTAQFRDEIIVEIGDKKNKHTLNLWFSTIYKYRDNKWQMVLFHGSMPDKGSSSTDTFHVAEAEMKLKELEKIVEKRTAELQIKNRELEIETSLEKVRAVAMGMKKQEDLLRICEVMFKELKKLGFADLRNAMVNINDDRKEEIINYDYSGLEGKTTTLFKYGSHAIVDNLIRDAKQSRENFTEVVYTGKKLQEWRKFRKANGEKDDLRLKKTDALYYYFYSTGSGATGISMFAKANDQQLGILKRFRNVFDLAYKRYVEISRAKAQAREAEIEVSLERVRSRSLAMHKSEELKEVIRLVLTEIRKLDVLAEHAGFYIDYKLHDDMHIWLADPNIEPFFTILPYFDTPTWNSFIKAKSTGTSLHTDLLDFKEKNKFYKSLFKIFTVPEEAKQFYLKCKGLAVSTVLLDNVGLYIENFSGIPYTDDENKVLLRFGKVFQQTYTRFLDLQKAEEQAREAQIEAALEKVRSRTLAMQHSNELAETSAELFRQLIGLGIEPNRLYITIIDEQNDMADFWITDEDGSKITDAYSANLNDNATFKKMYEGWKQQQKHMVIDMQGEELQNYFRYLQSRSVPFKGGLEQKRRVQHLAYFSKGFIGVASPEEQPAETIQLLDRFAAVFNLTFTRFNDLKIAEAHALKAEQDLKEIKEARKNAEEALNNLQATQKQLVQSEKMASLGELTAGIAHEIQNPLNFVNNFSEVSKELLDEMKEAIEKGDTEDAKEIMKDVIQNLEKINHHGKRADGIVKGMLQHSRSSSGQKELTDINALADEYLRLAFHGLRAKDKSFNAGMKTEFDESLEKINVIPQDIGRVILNLITNAFYAVNEKAKQNISGYEPTVAVSTKKANSNVEISVRDNGNGIPDSIKEKIFQPFFTTKPTGQGTGLGLSLSYDIVKAHGGELQVETKEGEGSTFIIQLPS